MTATIYFVRHGETSWNAQGRLQGQTDTHLNGVGRAQAERNGRVLAATLSNRVKHLDFVASPLARARETMEIIRTALGLSPQDCRTDPRLMEICYGDWQGATWDELRAQDPRQVDARFADPWTTVAPNGESYAMLHARAWDWFDDISGDTVVVSHGGIHRCLRGTMEKLERAKIPLMHVPQDKILVIKGQSLEWL